MTIKLTVLMDPIEHINIYKDSTFAMLLEAQSRGYKIDYIFPDSLHTNADGVYANTGELVINDDQKNWFGLSSPSIRNLAESDIVLMRKDPPFDMEYIYSTYLLERLHSEDTLVVNHPASLRNANEKLLATQFPNCCPPYMVSKSKQRLDAFIDMHKQTVLKTLDGMGGNKIFRIDHDDVNRNVIIESITNNETQTVIAQKFIPEYKQGDKRILLINGEPIPYALVRVPKEGELRANMAKGGIAKGAELNQRDMWICNEIKELLKNLELSFVGIDVIGDYLTEINITSPTGIRELDRMYELNICSTLFDHIETKLQSR